MTMSLVFGAWPYVAALLLFAGIAIRCMFGLTRFDLLGLREVLMELAGGSLRRSALVALILGHLAAVTLPHQLLSWSHGAPFLFVWESVAFLAAGVVLAGTAKQVWRQLVDASGSQLGQAADTVFLALLLAGTFSGVLMAILHRWASVWGVLLLTPYVHSLLAMNPSVEQLAQVPFLARVHIFSMISLLAVFPFSRFAILAIGPVQWGAAILVRLLAAAWLPCRRTLEFALRWASLTLGLSAEEE